MDGWTDRLGDMLDKWQEIIVVPSIAKIESCTFTIISEVE